VTAAGARFLIVNADDLGWSRDINAAIEELHRAGCITNTSLMVDAPHVEDGVAVLHRNPALVGGLHLDLGPVLGLFEVPYPQMRENAGTATILAGVAAEVERQIARFRSFDLEFTHMDSHRHLHALPEVFETVIHTAAACGLKTVRLAKDWILPRTPSVYWNDEFFRRANDCLAELGVRTPDHFVYGWRPYTEANFRPQWSELMVHVGTAHQEYLQEYRLLSSPEFRRRVEASGAVLRTYRDLAGWSAVGTV
jgi:predicted glycoside hydrolase/deacetylase ChbG (UPF0249 family)